MLRLPVVNGEVRPASAAAERLGFAAARESPCASCATSPCCTYIRLASFDLTNLLQVDYGFYLLNFDRIELGLHASGQWSVYYNAPCRFLDRATFGCTIHDTPRQPRVCVNYNPYDCWYRRVQTKNATQEFLRIDRRRLAFIAERLVFDGDRNVVEVPSWETMLAGMVDLPIPPLSTRDVSPRSDRAGDNGRASAEGRDVKEGFSTRPSPSSRGPTPMKAHTPAFRAAEVSDPCQGCAAYCCTRLVFPQRPPATVADLDYFKYLPGFPGVEIGVSDEGWSTVVATTCRHLVGHRCGAYGRPERPLRCRYYDAWKCTFKTRFGPSRAPGFARVTMDDFDALLDDFHFDASGEIVDGPTAAALRAQLDDRRPSCSPTSTTPSASS